MTYSIVCRRRSKSDSEMRCFRLRGETMEEVVGLKLSLGGYTLAVAESCTGGLLAQRMTAVPGSSKYFIEGVVTYANDAKTRALGVEPMLLMEHGAVSAPVAEAMAEGIRKRAETDFGLSITGIAGPGGGTEEKPVGTVFIALADDMKTESRKFTLPGDRNLVRWRASQAALDMLRADCCSCRGSTVGAALRGRPFVELIGFKKRRPRFGEYDEFHAGAATEGRPYS